MAYGIAEDPRGSVGPQLEGVDYPVGKETLVQAAADNGASVDLINLLKSLPRERYGSVEEVQRDLAEAARRFGMGNQDTQEDDAIRDRRNIGRDAVEGAPEGTKHP